MGEGHSLGGRRRAERLSAERRREIARAGATARWGGVVKGKAFDWEGALEGLMREAGGLAGAGPHMRNLERFGEWMRWQKGEEGQDG